MAETSDTLKPAIIVIFGVTGDLAQRYLLPALYHLFKEQLLHEKTRIIGLTRQDLSIADLLRTDSSTIEDDHQSSDPAVLQAMNNQSELLRFDPSERQDYDILKQRLAAIEAEQGVCMNRLYYLSIPPNLFETTVKNLGDSGLQEVCETHGTGQARLLVEKPFGSNLASAEELVAMISEVFTETQVFRIDHYLAKETVQNILTFRRSNPIFASIWDNQHISAIDITASEKIGIEGRVQFYEGVGALRDLIQSHLLQLLAVTTMAVPRTLNSDAIHASKQALLAAVEPANPTEAIRGQYEQYRQEVSRPDSTTETFASIKLRIDTDDWHDVPISITTGKALSDKLTEIQLTFKDVTSESATVNVLTFRIQPNEGIDLQLRVKKPGYVDQLQDAQMNFSYQQTFGDSSHPNAYERVLVDAIKGDRTLFATSEEVLQSWRIIEPVLRAWQESDATLQLYASGSNGPDRPS